MGMTKLAWYGIALTGLVGLAACSPAAPPAEPTRTFRNANTETAFVGDAVCANCHEDHWAGYQAHGMAQSYYPLTPENAVEDFSDVLVTHPRTGLQYRVFADSGRFFQEERFGEDEVHRLVREMHFVVGSGNAARTYLTEANGRLYEMPLTWYTQGEKWDFSPGYDEFNSRFDRLIPDRCMACHNSYPETIPFVEGKYAEVPNGIGCERCHGPGALHVEERLANPEAVGDYDDTIVNPAHLSLDLRLDVCQQCHLHTTVSMLREGRTPFDFRPSQPLAAHVALYAAETPTAAVGSIDVISHADRMKQSACFLETQQAAQPLECVTCHNPHEGFRDKGPDYFNATCLSCHPAASLADEVAPEAQVAHTPTANCIDCHMPKVQGDGTPHTTFTDHWVRVIATEATESGAAAPLPAQVHLQPYFPKAAGAAGERYEGMAYVIYGAQRGDTVALDHGIQTLAATLEADGEHGEAQFLLGYAHLQRGDYEAAIAPLEASIRLDPNIPERLNLLAEAYGAMGRDPTRVARLYQRALQIQPDLANVRVNYGRFLETQGRLADARRAYERALAEQPWLVAAWYNLGTLALKEGKPEEAEQRLQEALRLNPLDPEVLGNLGLLYATQGNTERAGLLFERAIEAAPESAVAWGNLGAFTLNERRDFAKAVEQLTRAVALDPEYVDALANLAVAYYQQGNRQQALRYAQEALRVLPSHPLARQVLAAL